MWAVTVVVLLRLRPARVYPAQRVAAAVVVAGVLLVAGGWGETTQRRVELTRLPNIEEGP